jgi:predicted DNA-binding protein (UPF0251 family)
MPPGRKKKCRNLEINMEAMICRIFGPLLLDRKKICEAEKVIIDSDEFQTIIYQDLDGLTMDIASSKMGISKTVYAGLYSSARRKLADAIFNNKVIHLGCLQDDFTSSNIDKQ